MKFIYNIIKFFKYLFTFKVIVPIKHPFSPKLISLEEFLRLRYEVDRKSIEYYNYFKNLEERNESYESNRKKEEIVRTREIKKRDEYLKRKGINV